MSALLKAAQGHVDAENAQKIVDNCKIKKFIVEKYFPCMKDLYVGSSQLLDIDAWARKAPNNNDFLAAMAGRLDSLLDGLPEQEAEVGNRIVKDVSRHFGMDPSVLQTDGMKERAASMSDQQCREALPLVIDLLGYQTKKAFMEMEQRNCFLRTKSANKNVIEIYLETAKELAVKVDQLENTVQDLSSSIRAMEKKASKTAAKLAKHAEAVEKFIGGVHAENVSDPLKRLARSVDKLSGLPPLNDSGTVKKSVYDSLQEAHDKLLHEVKCLKIGRERYRGHIDELKTKLNAAKQPTALGKKNKKQ